MDSVESRGSQVENENSKNGIFVLREDDFLKLSESEQDKWKCVYGDGKERPFYISEELIENWSEELKSLVYSYDEYNADLYNALSNGLIDFKTGMLTEDGKAFLVEQKNIKIKRVKDAGMSALTKVGLPERLKGQAGRTKQNDRPHLSGEDIRNLGDVVSFTGAKEKKE